MSKDLATVFMSRGLTSKLLEHGGFGVSHPGHWTPGSRLMEVHGRIFKNENIVRFNMEYEKPHQNVAELWIQSLEMKNICTGFALAPDGYWKRHSWLTSVSGQLVETTIVKEKYFGVVLRSDFNLNGVMRFLESCFITIEHRQLMIGRATEKVSAMREKHPTQFARKRA